MWRLRHSSSSSLLVALSLIATIAESSYYNNPASSRGSNFKCAQEGYFGDAQDCAVYYRCVDNGNGGPLVQYKFECGPGTVFSSDQGDICTYPDVCGRPECGGTNEQSDKINDIDSNDTAAAGTEKEKPGHQGEPESQPSPTPPPRGTCPSCGPSHEPGSAGTTAAVTRATERPSQGSSNTAAPASGPSNTDQASNASNFGTECTSPGFLADPDHCTKFYRCVDGENGSFQRYDFNCGDGTVWDPNSETCNHPWAANRVGCKSPAISNPTNQPSDGSQSTAPGQGSTEPTMTITWFPASDSAGSSLGTPPSVSSSSLSPSQGSGDVPPAESGSQGTGQPPNTPNVGTECTCAGFLADPDDCTKFYRCVDGGNGSFQKYDFNCGDGTVWDPNSETCNHPWAANRVGCKSPAISNPTNQPSDGSQSTAPGEGSTESTMTNTSPPGSDSNESWSVSTPSGSGSPSQGENRNNSSGSTSGSAGSGPQCSSEGFMADPKDCQKFYRCAYEGTNTLNRYEFTCGPGTIWDQKLLTCSHPWQSNVPQCRSSGASTPPPPPPQESRPEGSATIAPSESSTDAPSWESSSIAPPTEASSTEAPSYEGTSTVPPAEASTEDPSYEGSSMAPPTEASSTEAPSYEGTSTVPPAEASTEDPSYEGTSTVSPVEASTEAPSYEGSSTMISTDEASTETPSYEGSSMAPPDEASTEAPSYASSKVPPSESATQAPPNSASSSCGSCPECKSEGFFPNKKDCTKFYRCVKNERRGYHRFEFNCGPGTAWDQELVACNYVNQVASCKGLAKPAEMTTSFGSSSSESSTSSSSSASSASYPSSASSSDESSTSPSSGSSASEESSGSGGGSGSGSQPCDKPMPPTSTNGIVCNQEGFYANPYECGKFYRCVNNGNGFSVYHFDCAPGTIFDPSISACNHASAVYPPRNCEGGQSGGETGSEAPGANQPPACQGAGSESTETPGCGGDSGTTNGESGTTDTSTNNGSADFSSTGGSAETATEVTNEGAGESTTQEEQTTTPEYASSPESGSEISGTPAAVHPGSEEGTTQTEESSTEQSVTNEPPLAAGSVTCPIGNLTGEQIALVCPTAFRRHPKYCNIFYQCTSDDDMSVKILSFHCPDDTIFDEKKIECVPEEQSSEPCNGVTAGTRVYRKVKESPMSLVYIEQRIALCPGEGYYSHNHQECSNVFYKCKKNEEQVLQGYLYKCPQDFVFWRVSRRCERTSRLPMCSHKSNYVNHNENYGSAERWQLPEEKYNRSARKISS